MPPKKYRFQKGKSGNPAGRPKGSRNLSTVVLEAADKNMRVTIDGAPRSISVRTAAVMQLAKQAVGGNDHRSMAKFLDLVDEMERREEERRPGQFVLSELDVEILSAIHQRMSACENTTDQEDK